MRTLSDDLLIEAYKRAIECKLDKDFQLMLENEIMRRKNKMNEKEKSWLPQTFNFVINSDDDNFWG